MQRSHKLQTKPYYTDFPQESSHQPSMGGYFPRIRSAHTTSTIPGTFTRSNEHLKEIPRVVSIFRSEYNGGKHAAWARSLFRELGSKNKIYISQIEEYASAITEHINTIKHWSIQNIFDVFTHMSRVGFFTQIPRLGKSKEAIINLRNELLNQLNFKFEQMPLSPENQHSFVALLWGICDQINLESQITPIIHSIILKINSSFINSSFFLTSYNYKEISNAALIIILSVSSYKSIFNTLLEKHLDDMVKAAENEGIGKNNTFYAIYLSNTVKLIKHNLRPNQTFKANIAKLISHINFTEDKRVASAGLQAITALLERKEILLEDAKPIIEKCLNYIEGKELELEEVSLVLLSITRYSMYLKNNFSSETTTYLTNKIEYYLNLLIENKEKLSVTILTSLLRISTNLIIIEHPIAKNFEKIIQTYNKEKSKFLQLTKNDLHSVITCIGEISKKMKSKYQKYYAIEFAPLLNALMPRYMLESRFAALSENLNSIQALTELIECGFLANSEMKETYNDLFMRIDEKRQELTDSQLIEYIRNITMCFGLLSLDFKKIQEYKELIFNCSIRTIDNQSISTSKKLIFAWSILTFCEINRHIFHSNDLSKFNKIVTELYEQLSNENIAEQYLRILNFTANWLGKNVETSFDDETCPNKSEVQKQHLELLKAKYTDLFFEEEQSVNGLPPCDIMVREKKIIIEVQGMFHFLDLERTLKNGRTIIKNQLYKNQGYHVIEVKVVDGKISKDEMIKCIDSIDERIKEFQSLPKVEF